MCIRDRHEAAVGDVEIVEIPVSYTHLDVYKRQVDEFHAAALPYAL